MHWLQIDHELGSPVEQHRVQAGHPVAAGAIDTALSVGVLSMRVSEPVGELDAAAAGEDAAAGGAEGGDAADTDEEGGSGGGVGVVGRRMETEAHGSPTLETQTAKPVDPKFEAVGYQLY